MLRRRFLALGACAVAGALGGCTRAGGSGSGAAGGGAGPAALSARPQAGSKTGSAAPLPEPGTRPLGVAADRDALLHVPEGLPAGAPVPLVVVLHGAGGDAEAGLAVLRAPADEHGLVLLAPASRGSTWDAVLGAYGPDVEVVERALSEVFAAVPVDAQRVGVAGFSDGASYALGLGLANSDLFSSVVALSPGFVPRAAAGGRPRVFVAHGVHDEVLPIGSTSRRIVPDLREDGYDVTHREFDGGHVVPPEVAQEAVAWLGRDGTG
ncbi:alpha/beta hydrolase [Quadrisphaera sp. DSM 44207]|uniref:alpha/beta hydrolase n=1 Tax=Quadrisphaera sp. DSM 44207 TaxID=1881057 RepID=UPI0008885F05|nr:PHB depolymerase family esterase [Quadrisphaera sp. DSM 44207]SDQ77730.1 Predicted esterase [Quadrisphaera sp. DSM 44207]